MIFALATDDGSLMVFPDPEAAISYCEGIDVEEGGWLFWGEGGEALEAVFSEPNERGRFWVKSGVYSLRPSANGKRLVESMGQIRNLEKNPYFASLDSVVAHIASPTKANQYRA